MKINWNKQVSKETVSQLISAAWFLVLIVGIAMLFTAAMNYFIGFHNVDLMVNAMKWNGCNWDNLYDTYNTRGDTMTASEFYIRGNAQMRGSFILGIFGALCIGMFIGGFKS